MGCALHGMQCNGHDEGGLVGRAWRWRELVTRIASGAEASADISAAWWAGAEDLGGPNFPCPIGFQACSCTPCSWADVHKARGQSREPLHAASL